MILGKRTYKKKCTENVCGLLVTLMLYLISNGTVFSQSDDSLYVGKTWQISKGLDFANHQYTDIPVYNSNGSLALIMDDKGNYYYSKSLDSSPVKIEFKNKPKGRVQWDSKKPDVLYYLSNKNSTSIINLLNLATGEEREIYSTVNFISEIAPAHPDGEHLLLAPKDQSESVMEIYSLKTDVSIKIPMDVPLHRVRFTKSLNKLTVFINCSSKLNNKKTSWLVDPVTKTKREIYAGASGSPNWRIGGELFCCRGEFNGGRALLVIDTTGSVVKSFPEIIGHLLSWSPDGKYIVTDVEDDPANKRKSNYSGWICILNYGTGEINKIVRHGTKYENTDGEKYDAGYPKAQLSPDRTKVIYNSTKLGIDHPQVFVSFVKHPESVKSAVAKREAQKVIIEWLIPESAELKECIVYSIHKNGKIELTGSVNLPGTELVTEYNPDITGYSIITKEHSGLNSKPCLIKL
jgi:hypothetical protein